MGNLKVELWETWKALQWLEYSLGCLWLVRLLDSIGANERWTLEKSYQVHMMQTIQLFLIATLTFVGETVGDGIGAGGGLFVGAGEIDGSGVLFSTPSMHSS